MNPNTIRKIDVNFGQVICFLLTINNNFFNLFRNKSPEIKSKKVVFIKLIEQGATILAYSAIKKSL